MSKLTKIFAGILLAASVAVAVPGVAQARHWHGASTLHGVSGWHGGWGHRYRGGWGWRPRVYLRWGYPYYYRPYYPYYRSYYYVRPACRWVRVRKWRHHRRYWRRVWRCW